MVSVVLLRNCDVSSLHGHTNALLIFCAAGKTQKHGVLKRRWQRQGPVLPCGLNTGGEKKNNALRETDGLSESAEESVLGSAPNGNEKQVKSSDEMRSPTKRPKSLRVRTMALWRRRTDRERNKLHLHIWTFSQSAYVQVLLLLVEAREHKTVTQLYSSV